MSDFIQYPPQQLSFKKKNKEWRKKVVDWADSKTFFNYSPVRRSVIHKKINYDLVNGKLHMEDLELLVNPDGIQASFIPDNIQHYPIVNSKLNVLVGEELKRVFDHKVVVTNPNALSEIEKAKKEVLFSELQKLVEDSSRSEEEFNQNLDKLNDYINYEWQDYRELWGNCVLNHYYIEDNFPIIFNGGFRDAVTVGEEIYQCDIVGGEPTLTRLNPLNVRIFKSGYSNRIEDADMIIIEDYQSPGKIIDDYCDVLTEKDIKYIESLPSQVTQSATDSMGNRDERYGFVNAFMIDDTMSNDNFFWDPFGGEAGGNSLLPFDTLGNIRVLKVYWKSRRKIKKVKSYDPETGEEVFNFYPENYIIDESKGEEEQTFWINEAWEGTKIGDEVYVNMRPRVVQYNRLSNPSRCHFGIVGQIYNLNDSKPLSLVDMAKPFSYQYDIYHDRLNKLLAHNWGKLVKLDLALVPTGWEIDKWMYYAKVNNIAVIDSFKEGNVGAATGKLAGGLNNASSGVVDASFGNEIQLYISLLEFLKGEMAEVLGISKQREGQISNRETVGGVERATLQSSHITELWFSIHDDVKKRVCECFIETAKVAMKGRKKKFEYILPDYSKKIIEIDGDLFSENDYGLAVISDNKAQELNQKLDLLAQAAIQNDKLSFSTITKLYSSISISEKQRFIERDEQKKEQQIQQAQEQQMQIQQQQLQAQAQEKQLEMQQKDQQNIRDNETKIVVAQINSQAEAQRFAMMSDDGIEEPVFSEEAKANLKEKIREFDAKLKLDREKLQLEKDKLKENTSLKKQQIAASKNKPKTK